MLEFFITASISIYYLFTAFIGNYSENIILQHKRDYFWNYFLN